MCPCPTCVRLLACARQHMLRTLTDVHVAGPEAHALPTTITTVGKKTRGVKQVGHHKGFRKIKVLEPIGRGKR